MTYIVILFALLSSTFRAILNIIDRKIFGYNKNSVLYINLINNIFPFIILFALIIILNRFNNFIAIILNFKILLFSLVVQIVAYSFSLAFKYFNVHKVIVISKSSDVFIPWALFLVTGSIDLKNVIFSLLTTLICIPILFKETKINDKKHFTVIGFIILSLSLQAVFAKILMPQTPDFITSILFTTVLIFGRIIWSLPLMLIKVFKNIKDKNFSWKISSIIIIRAFISLGTQITFIYALGQKNSIVAWPIINSTPLFALFFSSIYLKETIRKTEILAIFGIVAFAVIRFIFDL